MGWLAFRFLFTFWINSARLNKKKIFASRGVDMENEPEEWDFWDEILILLKPRSLKFICNCVFMKKFSLYNRKHGRHFHKRLYKQNPILQPQH